MTRRRITTRLVSRTTQPKLPHGDEGKDLSETERKEKLRVIREDFDIEMELKIRVLEEEKKQLLFEVDVKFHSLAIQIPMAVRKMSMEDFIRSGGTIALALNWIKQNRNSRVEDTTSVRPICSYVVRGKNSQHDSILEDSNRPARKEAMRAPSSALKKGYRKGKLRTTTTQPPLRANSSRFRTPGQGFRVNGFETPLFTPKFDPRLPSTPDGERAPKRGERLVSIDGSPVCFDKSGKQKASFIPVKIGTRTLEIPSIPDDVDLSEITVPDLQSDTDKNIQRLHALLSSYLQKSGAT